MSDKSVKWTTVGKGRGKPGLSKKPVKPTEEAPSMPIAEAINPLAPTETSFGTFAEIQEWKHRREGSPSEEAVKESRGRKQATKRKHEKDLKREITLKEALLQVDVHELSTQLEESRMRFTSYPLVWLKDIADKLQSQLSAVKKESDPLLRGKADDYPLCEAGDDLLAMLSETYNELEAETLVHFYQHLLEQLMEGSQQGQQTHGLRILLQALLLTRPEIVGPGLQDEASSLLKKEVGHMKRLLVLLWSLGQMPNGNWVAPFRMWVHAVLPLLFGRSGKPLASEIQQDVVRHFHSIVSVMKREFDIDSVAVTKAAVDVVDLEHFLWLQQTMFVQKKLTAQLHEELRQVYPALKAVVFTARPKNQLRNFFPSLLVKLEKTRSEYEAELLSCAVDCLCEDDYCFVLWQQMQAKRLRQSMILVGYVRRQWPDVKQKMSGGALKETVDQLVTLLEECEQEEETEEGREAALYLQEQLSHGVGLPSQGFAWMLKVSLCLAIALIAIDIAIHREVRGSFFVKTLDRSGTLLVIQKALQALWNAILPLLSWLAHHVPLYAAAVVDKCWPLCLHFLKVISPYWMWLSSQGSYIASWVYDTLPRLWLILQDAFVLALAKLLEGIYRFRSLIGLVAT